MSLSKQEVHNKIYTVLFLALVFFIPLYQGFLNLIIVLIGANWLLEWNFREKLSRAMSETVRRNNLFFSVLYILYLLGLLYTDNFKYGLFDVEVKLSLLIFPVLISTIPSEFYETKIIYRILWSFVIGAFISTLICILFALIKFSYFHSTSDFYYSRLSVFLHPGYFSMYLNFAVAILIYFLHERWNDLTSAGRSIYIILIGWFFTFIILLSSKAGILSLAMIFLVCTGYCLILKKRILHALLMLIGISLAFWISFTIFPQSFGRLTQASKVMVSSKQINTDTKEGTAERLLIWRYSLDIIKSNFLFGLGTGDVKDGLIEVYKSYDIAMAEDRQLNAHNQYLQTFISIGLIGFMVLILMFILPAIYSIKDNYYLYLLFLIIVGFNFLVESILERQAGVIFYGFFNSYLFMIKKRL